MDANTSLKRITFGVDGRYSVSLECADDLTADERSMLEAWFETEVRLLQRHDRGYTDEQALVWECEALGIDPATQKEASDA
jgi:hypothetical protein